MKKCHIISILVTFFALILKIPCNAEESTHYGYMARNTWSAFQCSALASKMNNSSEEDRLFLYGYNQGEKLILALNQGVVEKQDLTEAPILMLMLLEGPNSDFILGRIYEASQEMVMDRLYQSNGESLLKNAKKQFWDMNCKLIGR